MQKLQCEICGSTDFKKRDDGLIQCEACGCSYTLEQARNMVSGTVEIIHGQSELEQGLQNVENLAKLCDYDRMEKIYESLKTNFSHEKRLWDSMLHLYYYKQILENTYVPLYKDNICFYDELEHCYKNLLTVCDAQEEKEKIQKEHDNFCKKWINDFINGNFNIIDSFKYHNSDMFFERGLTDFCNSFPYANKIKEQSNANIEGMKKEKLIFDKKGECHLNDLVPNAIHDDKKLWLIGKTYVYEEHYDGFRTKHIELKESFTDAKQIRKQLVDEWNKEFKENPMCPCCGKPLGMIVFGKRKCPKCNNKFSLLTE